MSSHDHHPTHSGDRGPRPHQGGRGKNQRQKKRGHEKGQGRANEGQSEIDALFNKTFTFQKTDDASWTLPSEDQLFCSAPESNSQTQDGWNRCLSDLGSRLRSIQGHLSDKDILEWHDHTSSTHRGGMVMAELKTRFHIELGTQAWCKFHEILATRHLIPDSNLKSGTLHTLHICEAPGAFISSLNHYIKTHKDKGITQWKWLGTSLNPHYEMNTPDSTIVDDRLILQTPGCWYFGEDDTGDVMSAVNLAGLERLVQDKMNGTVHLVTADGSVNCQDDPEHQEQRVFPLIYCQVLTALHILAPQGTLLIKMFTMYNANTACLMYLLNCAFKQVTVLKPVCSKAGNSEVYILCRSYIGRENLQPQLPILLQHFGPNVGETPIFSPTNLPSSFVTQLEKCSEKFTNHQMAAIEENLKLYTNKDPSPRQHIDGVRKHCVEVFIKRCRLRVARKPQKLMPNYGTKTCSMFSRNMRHRLHGSLEEREELGHRSWKEQLIAILRSLQEQGSKADLGESRPKRKRSSFSVSDQESREVEQCGTHQTSQMGPRLQGARDGHSYSGRELGSGHTVDTIGQEMKEDDQQSSAARCHNDGGHSEVSRTAIDHMDVCENDRRVTELDQTPSAQTINLTGIDGSHSGVSRTAVDHMDVCENEQGVTILVQTPSTQSRVNLGGIVGHVAAMEVGTEGTSSNNSSVEHSHFDQSHSASVSQLNVFQTEHDRPLKSEQSVDLNPLVSTRHPAAGDCYHDNSLKLSEPNGCVIRRGQCDGTNDKNFGVSTDQGDGCHHADSPELKQSDGDCEDGGKKEIRQNGALGGQRSTMTESHNGTEYELFTVQIPWIASGKYDLDSQGLWKIVTGHPLRAVFMSPFCQMQLLNNWRSVRTKAKILQHSTTTPEVKGHHQCDLSPQVLEVIESFISKRAIQSSDQEAWFCSGMEGEEMELLCRLAATHNAVIGSHSDNEPKQWKLEDLQHLLEREANRRFKSFFFKLLPSYIANKTEPTSAETEIKKHFLSACLLAMKELQTGGSLHIWVPGLLTRFSVCMIYGLSQTFDCLTLVRGQRSTEFKPPQVLVSCIGFHHSPQIEKNFQRVYERMKELHEEGRHDVLQFIPVLSLFNPDFDKAMTRFNESVLRDDLLHIVEAELALLDDQV
ncbi:uncharacterized protein LOC121421008 isoform X2 [Lytechinus variegatus]|uniref:uncharacterized protein LOC121421008 isoform X2 n=1 Tax=Lytechinus variegatus TaxID=7654 RepID=UPI001BB1ACCA|nr:uncharacterized protein LOC121421008 isoform X2 [Lytechinus variegatus]